MNISLVNKLPNLVYYWLRDIRHGRLPFGLVNFGSLGRVKPISKDFGFDRGLPVDRYYIENFLARHANDIQGHVLEIKEPIYTHKFGGDRITKSDVLHVEAGNPKATMIADLTNADHLSSDTFNCIILTQTLQFIYDIRAAIKTLHRILKPKGVLLVTVSGISQISSEDMERWGQYWSFTTLSIQQLLQAVFEQDELEITAYGNVLSAIAFLHGLATEELDKSKLDYHDPNYQVLISARAVK